MRNPLSAKARVKVYRSDEPGQPWRFHVVARNNRVLAGSENYTSKRKALGAAKLLGLPIEVED